MSVMQVNLRVHDGNQGFLEVMEGLVQRNERAIREGKVPLPEKARRVKHKQEPTWRDAPAALADGVANAGTMAAWMAAGERVKGKDARLVMSSGIPSVWIAPETRQAPQKVGRLIALTPQSGALIDGPNGIVSLMAGKYPKLPDLNRRWLSESYGGSAFMDPLGMALTPGTIRGGVLVLPSQMPGFERIQPQDLSGAISDDRGRVSEWLHLTLDDENAVPIREVGDAIARHNARQIRDSAGNTGTDAWTKPIPPLYDAGVRYEVEGLPELWKDSREICIDGFDDCEGFSAYRAGELMNHGVDAKVWTRQIKTPEEFGGSPGSRMFHAVTRVRLPNGTIEYDDPSLRLGMPVPAWYNDYAKRKRMLGEEL